MGATRVYGPFCPKCGLVAPPGLRAHYECALAATRERVNERIERDLAKEKRDERSKLDTAALVGARQERERIVEMLRERARELRFEGQRCSTEAASMACAQRAAALDEMAGEIEGKE